jgi:hypothetical protein
MVAMSNGVALGILWTCAALLTAGCAGMGVLLNIARAGFAAHKPGTPIVIFTIVVWLLHLGYLLGPWLWQRQSHGLAMGLMIPAAALCGGGGLIALMRISASEMDGRPGRPLGLIVLLVAAAGLFAYAAPIVVMLAGSSRR